MSITLVKTRTGIISGMKSNNPEISVFKGIPYATPPVGELRWKEPKPLIPWNGERKANHFGNICVQDRPAKNDFFAKEFPCEDQPMSEDCLYLNIWTPADTMAEKLPVMVWLHGGLFVRGYGHKIEFDGEGLAQKGVVMVSINYRLGVFGYLAHPDLSKESTQGISGNYGLMDQLAALKWINHNISEFGGDPNNVTVFGQSAGAMSIQALVSSPLASGLISKAIMQSGGGIHMLLDFPALEYSEKIGLEFASLFHTSSVDALRCVSAEELLEKSKGFHSQEPAVFRPNIDGYMIPEDVSLAEMNGNTADIPYLIGTTHDDWQMKLTEENFRKIAAFSYGRYAEKYLQLFEDRAGNLSGFSRHISERMTAAAVAWAEIQNTLGRVPAYLYRFDHKLPEDPDGSNKSEPSEVAKISVDGIRKGDYSGAFHTSELGYLFKTLSHGWRPYEKADYELSDQMAQYWTNFAKNGDPNGKGLAQWKPYTKENRCLMKLDVESKMEKAQENPRVSFLCEFLSGKMK